MLFCFSFKNKMSKLSDSSLNAKSNTIWLHEYEQSQRNLYTLLVCAVQQTMP